MSFGLKQSGNIEKEQETLEANSAKVMIEKETNEKERKKKISLEFYENRVHTPYPTYPLALCPRFG